MFEYSDAVSFIYFFTVGSFVKMDFQADLFEYSDAVNCLYSFIAD